MRIGTFSILRELTFAVVKDWFVLLERKLSLTGIATCSPCLVPRRLSSMCAQRKAGMVPCGSSPVTRVSRSPLPCGKRSA